MKLTPILIIIFSILLGIIILTKVILGMKFRILKEQSPRNSIEYFILYFISIILMWIPVTYNGIDIKLKRLKTKINIVTYILYGLVIVLATVIYIQIYRIRNN